MSKRKHLSKIPRLHTKKLKTDIDVEIVEMPVRSGLISEKIEIPDLTGLNMEEAESKIFEVIRQNNISNSKAKYLIREMLKHPDVIDWFKNKFLVNNPEFSLPLEPRITRATKPKVEEVNTSSSNLDANLIGRLLLSVPTINSFEFDEDQADIDYLPESESNDDNSSISSTDVVSPNENDIILSPYRTRSRGTISDFQFDLNEDSFLNSEYLYDTCEFPTDVSHHQELTLAEIHDLMDRNVDDELYQEFKRSLNLDELRNDEFEDDPEFNLMEQIEELDEDLYDDYRYDRSVKISKSELWDLLKDNKLVDGNGNTISSRKTITMLCEDDDIIHNEPCSNIKEMFQNQTLKFSQTQKTRLSRQIAMFYQQIATNYLMLYDQPQWNFHLNTQIDLFMKLGQNITGDQNSEIRSAVEKILFNYKGLSYLPPIKFNKTLPFKKVRFPKCLLATFLSSNAFPYCQLLPTAFKVYSPYEMTILRPTSFLPSEDTLLTHGILQFNQQSAKMLKLIRKYLFPIRSIEQLKYRKTNMLRRNDTNDPKALLLGEILKSATHYDTQNIKVVPDLSNLPYQNLSIWQRKDEWNSLPESYISFIVKSVPDVAFNAGLCSRDEYVKRKRYDNSKRHFQQSEIQFCNWSSLPWQTEQAINCSKQKQKQPKIKTVIRKVIIDKSFPQYEISNNDQFQKLLEKYNSNVSKRKSEVNTLKSNNNQRELKLIYFRKTLKKAKEIINKTLLSRARLRDSAMQKSYAHYFRNDMEKLFPKTIFRIRFEKLLSKKVQKNPRMQKFLTKCQQIESDFVDPLLLSVQCRDEEDLIFCRNFLTNLRTTLTSAEYEKFLDKINEFQMNVENLCDNEMVLELMKYLLNILKSKQEYIDLYQDLLSLLKFQQAIKLGCEVEYWMVKNVNQLFNMIKSSEVSKTSCFWVRLSNVARKWEQGVYPISKTIRYLHHRLKDHLYLQSELAPLLNCWETPHYNYSQIFSTNDVLSNSPSFSNFSQKSEFDDWDYFTDLSEQSKNQCDCSCHDNVNREGLSAVRHCVNCCLKVSNGYVHVDEGKIHKGLVSIKWPDELKMKSSGSVLVPDDTRQSKPDAVTSISVVEFLKSKNVKPTKLHSKCISVRERNFDKEPTLESPKKDCSHMKDGHQSLPNHSNFFLPLQTLEDTDAAMDSDFFRYVKGLSTDVSSLPNNSEIIKKHSWTDDENLVILKVCQEFGPTCATFKSLQSSYFPLQTVTEIENQFNELFKEILEYQKQSLLVN